MEVNEAFRSTACHAPTIKAVTSNRNPDTTVLAHYRLSGHSGIGMKPDDWSFGAWACSDCHDVVDGRAKTDHDRAAVRLAHAEGCLKTQAKLREMKRNGEI